MHSLRSRAAGLVLVVSVACALIACEKVNHENIDKWKTTEKGPGKLLDAFKSADHPADIRAHAAQNLIALGKLVEVKDTLAEMRENDRHPIVAELAPLLWEDARIAGELDVPNMTQVGAKDALFYSRDLADAKTVLKIDEYLLEWLTGGHFDGRSSSGSVSGAAIVRAIGKPAGPKLIEALNRTIARPEEDGKVLKIGDQIMIALAVSGDPKALGRVIDLVNLDRSDDTLADRAVGAMYRAYVKPSGFEAADGKNLVAGLDRIEGLVMTRELGGRINNDAIELVAAVGAPECVGVFQSLIADREERWRWIGVQRGIRCGGVEALKPIAEALPTGGSYERGYLSKYMWDEVLEIGAPGVVAERARALLASEKWPARVTGVELLGALGRRDGAAADAERIRALAGDPVVLRGWHKDEKGKRKKDPSLGQVAREVAKRLEEVAKGTKTK